MNKHLTIRIDNTKSVKDSSGNDVNVLFSLSVPYGVPYALAAEALQEFANELNVMSQTEPVKQPEEKEETTQEAPAEQPATN